MKYRKKPVVIEAIQFTGDNEEEIKEWLKERGIGTIINMDKKVVDEEYTELTINIRGFPDTLEICTGNYLVSVVDWVEVWGKSCFESEYEAL